MFLRPGDIVDTNSRENVGSYLKIAKIEKEEKPYVPGDELATIYIRMDNFQEYSEKTLHTVVELAAELGGLSEVAYIIGLTFTEIFTSRLFVADMISHLFMVPKKIEG